jgi:hypothetical protein
MRGLSAAGGANMPLTDLAIGRALHGAKLVKHSDGGGSAIMAVRFQRVRKNFGALAAQNIADRSANVCGSAHDLPYGRSLLRQRKNRGIGFFALLATLKLLGVARQTTNSSRESAPCFNAHSQPC